MLVAVLATVVALSSGAPAQERKRRDPSPQELWNAYPLDPPRDGVAVEVPASNTPTATPSPQSGGAGPSLVLGGLLIAAVFGIGLILGMGRLRRRRPATGESPAAEPAAPISPAPPPAPRFRPKRTPIPVDAWRCYIAWRAGPRGARFRALAQPPGAAGKRLQIACSVRVDWPPYLPPTPEPELLTPARALAGALVEAGWRPTDCGTSWYSQRFVWPGSEAPEPLGEIAPAAMVEHG